MIYCSLFGAAYLRPNGIKCTCGISTCGVAIINENQKGPIVTFAKIAYFPGKGGNGEGEERGI